MAVAGTAAHHEVIGGHSRRLLLGNGEIERFERLHSPLGIYEMMDQLGGRAAQPQARHVRDLVALALIGGGMADSAADDLVAAQPPSENIRLRVIATLVLGAAFYPLTAEEAAKKKADLTAAEPPDPAATTPPDASETSVP